MIHENDPAQPTGAYGQQETKGETILMKYSAMFMAHMIGKPIYSQDTESLCRMAIVRSRALIAELNKEIIPSNPIPLH